MSGATNAAPMPCVRMNVNFPRFTFLSWAIRSINWSAPGTSPGMSKTWVGNPTAARCRCLRSVSAGGDHQDRLVERADQVFAAAGIDRGLAAHRGIDLGEQRRRHLNVIEAAPYDGRREPREITDHAAAERDHQITAFDLGDDQFLAHALKRDETFRGLALPHNDCRGRYAGPR